MSKRRKSGLVDLRLALLAISFVFLALLSSADISRAQSTETQFGYVSTCDQEEPLGTNRYVICESYVKKLPVGQSEALYFLRQRIVDLIASTTADSDWALGRLVLTTWVIAVLAVVVAGLTLLAAKWPGVTRVATMLFSVALIIIAVATSFGYSKQYSGTITYRLSLIVLRDAIDTEFVQRVSNLSSTSAPPTAEQTGEMVSEDKALAALTEKYITISETFAKDYGDAFGTIALPSLLGS